LAARDEIDSGICRQDASERASGYWHGEMPLKLAADAGSGEIRLAGWLYGRSLITGASMAEVPQKVSVAETEFVSYPVGRVPSPGGAAN
jgi:hypothetical protein